MAPTQPLVSVDVVPFRYERGAQVVTVALGRRIYEPFLGVLALPGVLLGHERAAEAAARALASKIGAGAEDVLAVEDVGVFDNPDRDPRGPTLSVAKFAVLAPGYAPDPGRVELRPLASDEPLPFDHSRIVDAAARALLAKLWTDRQVARALLGEVFSTRDVASVQRQLGERATGSAVGPDSANLQRRLRLTGWVSRAEGVGASSPLGGRPATLWRWTNPPG